MNAPLSTVITGSMVVIGGESYEKGQIVQLAKGVRARVDEIGSDYVILEDVINGEKFKVTLTP